MIRKILIIVFVFTALFISTLTGKGNTQVIIETPLGNIHLEIYQAQAPITANNFLKYVKLGLYKNTSFMRTVTMKNQPNNKIKIEVIQSSGVQRDKTFDPIQHETTKTTWISHKNGTISMARANPGTARASFFICINDQPELDFGGKRNPDGQGFAAFGKVVKGMEIVRKIQNSPCKEQNLTPRIKINKIYLTK